MWLFNINMIESFLIIHYVRIYKVLFYFFYVKHAEWVMDLKMSNKGCNEFIITELTHGGAAVWVL